jgi:hypothetical protein
MGEIPGIRSMTNSISLSGWHSREFFGEHTWVFSHYWDILYGLGFHVENHYV